MQTADGTYVTVKFDKDFNVIGREQGFAALAPARRPRSDRRHGARRSWPGPHRLGAPHPDASHMRYAAEP
jgi:hypothetical protein